MYRSLWLFGIALSTLLVVAACSSETPTATPVSPTPTATKAASTLTSIPPTATSVPTPFPTATATPVPTATPIPGTPVVKVTTNAKLGDIITDVNGKTLYGRDGESQTTLTCTAACLNTWPPFVAPEGAIATPPGVTGKIEVFARSDNGVKQIMFNGSPLYYFVRDTTPGDANGAGLGNFWTRKADGTKVSVSTQPTPTPTGGSGTPASVAPKASNVQDFTVETFTVPVGTRVTWTNQGATEHQLKSTSAQFDSGIMALKGTFAFTFTKAGVFDYVCTIHYEMTGKVTVQ